MIPPMSLLSTLESELASMSSAGTLKRELSLKGAQGPFVDSRG